MKVDLRLPFQGLSGDDRSAGGLNYYRYRGSQVARRSPKSENRGTANQRTAREWFLACLAEWGGLSPGVADLWEDFAKEANEYTGEGRKGPGGYGWFLRVRLPQGWGWPYGQDGPPTLRPHFRAVGDLIWEGPPGEIYWKVEWRQLGATEPTVMWYVLVSAVKLSARRKARRTDMRIPLWAPEDTNLMVGDPNDTTALQVNKLYSGWEDGDWVEVWIRPVSGDGWPGIWERKRGQVSSVV